MEKLKKYLLNKNYNILDFQYDAYDYLSYPVFRIELYNIKTHNKIKLTINFNVDSEEPEKSLIEIIDGILK